MTLLDTTRPVRPGEELDAAKLAAYLEPTFAERHDAPTISQFPGGYSNLTYLVTWGGREMVLRRPPFGANIKSAHDMGREYRILSRLITVYPRIPRTLAFCEDESVIGANFYLMERVPGIVLRAKPPEGLSLTPDFLRELSQNVIDNLVELHACDYQSAGLGDLGKPVGYVERQVTGWSQRYANAKTDALDDMEFLIGWVNSHMPRESGAALIHNDYKYDNLLLDATDPTRIRAVLDWEMATVGDPLMDFGTAVGYWVDPDDPEEMRRSQFGLTTLPGNLRRAEVIERYASRSGRDVGDILFYYVFALFKLAVVVQQIYARYLKGHTRDERFASLIDTVRAVSLTARRAVELGRIEKLG